MAIKILILDGATTVVSINDDLFFEVLNPYAPTIAEFMEAQGHAVQLRRLLATDIFSPEDIYGDAETMIAMANGESCYQEEAQQALYDAANELYAETMFHQWGEHLFDAAGDTDLPPNVIPLRRHPEPTPVQPTSTEIDREVDRRINQLSAKELARLLAYHPDTLLATTITTDDVRSLLMAQGYAPTEANILAVQEELALAFGNSGAIRESQLRVMARSLPYLGLSCEPERQPTLFDIWGAS